MSTLFPARRCGLIFAFLYLMTFCSAYPAPVNWTNTAGGTWSSASNWSPNQAPGDSDTAYITNSGTYAVVLDISPTVTSLVLGGSSGQQTLSNATSTLTLHTASVVNSNGIFRLDGGTIGGPLTVAANGVFSWTGGVVGASFGSLTIASNGVLNISGSGIKYVFGPVYNFGTATWTGTGYVEVYNNLGAPYTGAIYNQVGGLFDIQTDQFLHDTFGTELISNAGLWRKSAGTGTSTMHPQFSNSGTIEADTGILSFIGGYSSGSSARMAISVGGSSAPSGFGQITMTTPLTLTGTFAVSTRNGFRPNSGDSFLVLSFPSSTGSFGCISGLDLGAGLLLQPQFTATTMSLTATSYATNSSLPQLSILASTNSVSIAWPLGYPNWVLLSTTNLASPAWLPVSQQCGNQAVVPVAGSQQFFRLHQSN